MSEPQTDNKQQILIDLLKNTEGPVATFHEPEHTDEGNPQAVLPG